jgi:hypothetical protein
MRIATETCYDAHRRGVAASAGASGPARVAGVRAPLRQWTRRSKFAMAEAAARLTKRFVELK